MYTLAFALLALVAIFLWDTLNGRRWAWIGLGVSMAAAVLTHYSTVFVLVALYLFAVLVLAVRYIRGEKVTRAARTTVVARRLLFAGALSLVLFLPQAPRAYAQIAPYGNPNLVVPSFGEYVSQLWHAYTVGIPLEGAVARYGMWGFAAVLLGAGMAAASGRRARVVLGYLLVLVVVPVLMYYAVLVGRATFAPRYISFVVPFLALLLGLSVAGWARRHRGVAALWVVILGGFLVLGIRADQFNPRYFREDTSGLARWLMANTRADDLILIDVPYPLGFYYPRYSRNPDVPPPAEPAVIAPAYYLFVDIRHVDERITSLAAGKRRIFWVQWFKSDTDPRGAVRFLLDKYGVHEGQTAFRGYTVDWYRVLPDTPYRLAGNMRALDVSFDGRMAATAIAAGQAPDLPPDMLRASDRGVSPRPVWAVVDWQRTGVVDKPYKVSARLEDPLGQVVAQDDRRLLSDRHLATPYWEPGERARNVYLLSLPVGTPPGVYTLTLRVYDPDSLTPLLARDGDGRLLGTDARVATVRVRKAPAFPQVSPIALADAPIAPVEFALGAESAAPGTVVPVRVLWVKQYETEGDPLRVQLALQDEGGRSFSVDEAWPVSWYPTSRWRVGEVVRSSLPWRIAPDTPNGTYTVHLRLLDRESHPLGEMTLGRLTVEGRAHRFQAPPPAHVLNPAPRLDDVGLLLGYDITGQIAPSAHLAITLTWQALGPSPTSLKVSVQVLDRRNQILAQEDHIPLRGEAPTTSWLPGEILQDRFDLHLPAQIPSGSKRVIVSLYESETLRRVPVVGGDGRALGDHVELFRQE